MRIDVTFIRLVLFAYIRVQVYGNRCTDMNRLYILFFDEHSLQKYCFIRSLGTRTYSAASEYCRSINAKLVTPHGKYRQTMFPLDDIDRWIDVNYDHTLKMYVQNGGVPMDTRWLRPSLSPWDTVGGHPSNGREELDCTVIHNLKWKSVSCTNSYKFVCEFKLCPTGWVYNPFVDRCNKFLGYTETFENATQRCSQEEAIIETPRSREAELFLKNLVSQSNPSKMWIGMMILQDTWRWNDGAKVTWTAWDGITADFYANQRHENYKHSPTYKCMISDGTAGDQEPIWHRSGCNTDIATYVCGKLRCRYPYYSYVNPVNLDVAGTTTYHTCYRFLSDASLNARQAGQFCTEDGSESNPSRLASPDHQEDYVMLNKVAPLNSIWTGYAWNRVHYEWQSNDNTFVTDSYATINGVYPLIRYPHIATYPNPQHYICTIHEPGTTYLTPKPCDREYFFVCEREQPYVITTCPEKIQTASSSVGQWNSIKPYYPRVPQSQRMNCYYYTATYPYPYNDKAAYMNYAEADRYCAGLGGYITMPKSRFQMVEAMKELSFSLNVWIGADSIDHCFNRNYKCTPHSNNFKYIDGSDLALNEWSSTGADNKNDREYCISVWRGNYEMSTEDCTKKRAFVCQVDHNNLKAQRNWDFLTACDGNPGVPNWYAAPGDKCFHMIWWRKKSGFSFNSVVGLVGQIDFVSQCSKLSKINDNQDQKILSNDVRVAQPKGKDQTRSMVLSRFVDILSTAPLDRSFTDSKSFIGVFQSPWYPRDSYLWWPEVETTIPPQLLNFKPGTILNKANAGYECVLMTGDGKWEKAPCSTSHFLSCEKSSLQSLSTWRSAQRSAFPLANSSGSDVPRLGRMCAAMVITISVLFLLI